MTMEKIRKVLLPLTAVLSIVSTSAFAGGITMPPPASHFRASAAIGTRNINSQVMRDDAWGNLLRLGFAAFGSCRSDHCRYGLEIAGNSAWVSRFNSVNNPTSTAVGPVGLYNSPSLDFLFFVRYVGHHAGFEIGVGPQLSWIKWQNTVQQATSRFRVAPKVRFAVTGKVASHTELFLAVSQAFNVYDKLGCASGAFNCFNDSGYVNVTDFTIGINRYF